MPSDRIPGRLAAPSLLLAVALLMGAASPAIARDADPEAATQHPVPERLGSAPHGGGPPAARPPTAWRTWEATRPTAPMAAPLAETRPVVEDMPVAKPVAVAKSTSTSSGGSGAGRTYSGRNHVWIPALGIDRSVAGFACSSKAYPGNRVYRWGCAGANNVYLFGHAHSVFKPLHDAYVAGRLRKGMIVKYAGSNGVVHTYAVRWWKVTTPDKGGFAFASQSRPSMTLQTCVGANSQYRLVVRLAQTD